MTGRHRLVGRNTSKVILSLTAIFFLLDALPFLEIPFLLVWFSVATFTDSLTGCANQYDFSDWTQVSPRADRIGATIAILMAAGTLLALWYGKSQLQRSAGRFVQKMQASTPLTIGMCLACGLLAAWFIWAQGWGALTMWRQG